jgi:hypothetical protein
MDDGGHDWTALLRIRKQQVRSSSLLVGSAKPTEPGQLLVDCGAVAVSLLAGDPDIDPDGKRGYRPTF